MRLGDVVVAAELDQIAGEGVLAVRGDVSDVQAAAELPHTGDGRGPQLVRAGAADVTRDLGARVRLGLLRLLHLQLLDGLLHLLHLLLHLLQLLCGLLRLLCRNHTRRAAQREQNDQPFGNHENPDELSGRLDRYDPRRLRLGYRRAAGCAV